MILTVGADRRIVQQPGGERALVVLVEVVLVLHVRVHLDGGLRSQDRAGRQQSAAATMGPPCVTTVPSDIS